MNSKLQPSPSVRCRPTLAQAVAALLPVAIAAGTALLLLTSGEPLTVQVQFDVVRCVLVAAAHSLAAWRSIAPPRQHDGGRWGWQRVLTPSALWNVVGVLDSAAPLVLLFPSGAGVDLEMLSKALPYVPALWAAVRRLLKPSGDDNPSRRA
ncbi:hypothetical protein F0U60_37540 [Archangium minus]|uniref:Holin n=1 Tax=Archangium minus TaxID=83450 RepID=A0ABY9X1E2_9BACT|nr:hypothetical protein F0U60_37540 [Archangium minus]